LKYACSGCGFASRELSLGPAPRPDKFDPVLVSCDRRKTLRAIHLPDAKRGCRKHRRPFTILDENKNVACARCGRPMQQECVAIQRVADRLSPDGVRPGCDAASRSALPRCSRSDLASRSG